MITTPTKRMGYFSFTRLELMDELPSKVWPIQACCSCMYEQSDLSGRTERVYFAVSSQFDEVAENEEVPYYTWVKEEDGWVAKRVPV